MKKVSFILLAALCSAIIISCNKSDSGTDNINPGTNVNQFLGTWNCTGSTCGLTGRIGVITAGSGGGNTLTLTGPCGPVSCLKTCTLTGTADSNSCSFTNQTVVDACGTSWTGYVKGLLNRNILILTETISGSYCVDTCTKQ